MRVAPADFFQPLWKALPLSFRYRFIESQPSSLPALGPEILRFGRLTSECRVAHSRQAIIFVIIELDSTRRKPRSRTKCRVRPSRTFLIRHSLLPRTADLCRSTEGIAVDRVFLLLRRAPPLLCSRPPILRSASESSGVLESSSKGRWEKGRNTRHTEPGVADQSNATLADSAMPRIQ